MFQRGTVRTLSSLLATGVGPIDFQQRLSDTDHYICCGALPLECHRVRVLVFLCMNGIHCTINFLSGRNRSAN